MKKYLKLIADCLEHHLWVLSCTIMFVTTIGNSVAAAELATAVVLKKSAPFTPLKWDAVTSSIFDPVIFNWQFYLDANADLRNAGISTIAKAKDHWKNFGQSECRRASADFNSRAYLSLNPDLSQALGASNCKAAIDHYLSMGRLEGRQKTEAIAYGWQQGAVGTSLLGNATFGNDKMTFRTSAVYAGTITELWFRGKQFINSHDTGRLFQTAFTFDHFGECFNPTEAGSAADISLVNGTLKGKSQSKLNYLHLGAGTLVAETTPAYWYSPGMSPAPYCGIPQGLSGTSPDKITKTISMNHGGDSQIVRWHVEADVANDHSSMSLEALTGYLTADFDTFYTYDPAARILNSSQPARLDGSTGVPTIIGKSTHLLPTVVATADGNHAIGIVALDQEMSTPDGITRAATNYQISSLNPNDATDSTTKWSVAFRYSNVKKGKYSTTIYLVLGNLVEVTERMIFLTEQNSNQFVNLLSTPTGCAAFDINYYLTKYPDLQNAYSGDFDLTLEHYILFGMPEGRNGSSSFNAKNYLNTNPDLQAAFGSNNSMAATKHWLQIGRSEGRSGMPAP